jgi:hypothetical protein
MWTSLWMIKVNKQDFEYKKFIQEVYPDKILSEWNLIDENINGKYRIHSIHIHIINWNTYIYDWHISEILIDNNSKKFQNISHYFKDYKVCSLYQYDTNNSIWYSFYEQWKLISKEEINWEIEIDKLIIDNTLSIEEQDEVIENFNDKIFDKKYSNIYDKIVNIERANFKYSDIAEEWWNDTLQKITIIIKDKIDNTVLKENYNDNIDNNSNIYAYTISSSPFNLKKQFLISYYLNIYWASTSNFCNYRSHLYFLWLWIICIIFILNSFLPNSLQLLWILLSIYININFIRKIFYTKSLYFKILMFSVNYFWIILIFWLFIFIIEMIKIKFM